MKFCTCFLLFGIFAYTNTSPITEKKAETAVNLAARTGDNKMPAPYSNVETYIDFITEIINILNTYKDETFQDFVYLLDKEIRNHFKKHDIKTLLHEQLDLILKKPISEMRAVVGQATFGMILIKFDDNMRKYIDHINSLYKDNARNNFRNILAELKAYVAGYDKTRTKDDFVITVREFVKASVFNYDDLNTDLIQELRKYIAPFFKKNKESPSTTSSTSKLIRLKTTVRKLDKKSVKFTEKIFLRDKILESSIKTNPKTISLARKAVHKENTINDLDKIVTGDNNTPAPYSNVETFVDFITEIINILNTYKYETFKDFVHILDKEIRNHFKNRDVKTLLYEQLDLILKKPISEMRAVVGQATFGMILIKFDDNMRKYIDHINSLYKDNARNNFRKILTELKAYDAGYGKTRTKDDFVITVREFVKASVFNQDDLNTDLIRELRKYIAPFFKKNKESPSTTSSITKLIRFKTAVDKLDRITEKMSTEDVILKDSSKENRRIRRVNISPRTVHKININENFKNDFIATEDTINNSDKYSVKIIERKPTKDKIIKTSLKTNPTPSTTHLRAENKRNTIFRTKTREVKEEDKTATFERRESSSQQKIITDSNTDETVTEVMRYVTMEEPEIFFKSERRSKLAEKMMGESAGRKRRRTAQTTTTYDLRLSTESSLRRIKPIPLPDDQLAVEVFTKERSRSKKKDVFQEFKNDMKIRQIKKEANRLKEIDEMSHNSKAKVITEREDENMNTVERDREKKKRKKNKLVSGAQSYEYETRVLRPRNKVKNAEDNAESTARIERVNNNVKSTEDSVVSEMGVQKKENEVKNDDKVVEPEERIEKETNVPRNSETKDKISNSVSESGLDLAISDEIDESNDNIAQKSKFIRNKYKTNRKYARTCNCDFVEAETSTKPYKKQSKNNKVPRITEPQLATDKDNNIDNTKRNNKKLDNIKFKTTNKVDNTTLNISEDIEQSRIDNTLTDSNNKVTEDYINEMQPNHKFRRVLDSFPSLFEGNTLKEGLYPARLWD